MVEHMMNIFALIILGGGGRGGSLDYFKSVVLVGEITGSSKSSITGFLMAHALVLGEGPT